jgi:hypothetical protein
MTICYRIQSIPKFSVRQLFEPGFLEGIPDSPGLLLIFEPPSGKLWYAQACPSLARICNALTDPGNTLRAGLGEFGFIEEPLARISHE